MDKQEAIQFYEEGKEYFKRGEFDKAIDSNTKAIELDPNNAASFNNRGLCCDKKDITTLTHEIEAWKLTYGKQQIAVQNAKEELYVKNIKNKEITKEIFNANILIDKLDEQLTKSRTHKSNLLIEVQTLRPALVIVTSKGERS